MHYFSPWQIRLTLPPNPWLKVVAPIKRIEQRGRPQPKAKPGPYTSTHMPEVFHSSSSGKVARSALQVQLQLQPIAPSTPSTHPPRAFKCNFSYIMRTMFETLAGFWVANLMHRPWGRVLPVAPLAVHNLGFKIFYCLHLGVGCGNEPNFTSQSVSCINPLQPSNGHRTTCCGIN